MTNRRTGWMPLPMKCPTCDSRIREDAVLVHGAAVRCRKCNVLVYTVMAAHLRMAFVAEVTIAEVRHMQAKHMTLHEVIIYLGASFPTTQAAS